MFSKFFPNFKVSPFVASAAIASAALAMASMGTITASASVIYSDSFTGTATTTLNGSTPTIDNGTSSKWTGASPFMDNGTVSTYSNDVSAYLSFAPASGHIYQLAADLNPNLSGSTLNSALEIGFIGSPNTNLALGANGPGYAWAEVRTDTNSIFYAGPGSFGNHYYAGSSTGSTTVSILLNTTPTLWTYQFTVDGTTLSSPAAFTSNPPITAVGLGALGSSTINGTFSNFSLTESSVPEPASLGLLAVGVLGLYLLLGKRHRV